MAKYRVEVIVTGMVTADVEAEDVLDAKNAALEVVDRLQFGSRLSKITTSIGCVEDENHRNVTFGRHLPSCGAMRSSDEEVRQWI